MIVSKDDVKRVLAGGPVDLRAQVEVGTVGTVQALQTKVGKLASCTVRILDIRPDGCTVELASRPVEPLYLAPGNGYTTEPEHAVQDEAGVAEWAPPKDWKDPGAEARARHHRALQSDELDRRLGEVDSWDELVRLKVLARERGIDIRSDMRVIERRVDAIKDKIRAGRQVA